jgi:ubiquinone/menaquinone biosynthesis C-methylase UbiE
MQVKYEDYAGVEFLVMDARELRYFDNEKFSIIIDKGCLDSIFCSTNFIDSTLQVCKEVYRVLKKDCPFMCVSYGTPMSRVPYFRRIPWSVDICPIPGGEGIVMFSMIKTTDEKLLNKKVAGGEAAVQQASSHIGKLF